MKGCDNSFSVRVKFRGKRRYGKCRCKEMGKKKKLGESIGCIIGWGKGKCFKEERIGEVR